MQIMSVLNLSLGLSLREGQRAQGDKWEDKAIPLPFTDQPKQGNSSEFPSPGLERLPHTMCQVQGQNPTVVCCTEWKTSWTHKDKVVELCHLHYFFNMSVVLVMETVDSNFNQHLLLFQHIPLVKGNDDFPVRLQWHRHELGHMSFQFAAIPRCF
jgi:hypothetical protein